MAIIITSRWVFCIVKALAPKFKLQCLVNPISGKLS